MIAVFGRGARERRDRVSAMARAVQADSENMIGTHAMLTGGLLLLSMIQESFWMLFFGPFYFLLDGACSLYVRRVAARDGVSTGRFASLQATHLICSGTFTGLAVWVSSQGSFACLLAGFMLLAAQVVHSIAVHAESPDFGWTDVGLVALGLQGVAAVNTGWATPSEIVFLHTSLVLLAGIHGLGMMQARQMVERLRRTSTRLVRAQRSGVMGELASGIAHDFNNLLTVMRGNLDLLREVPECERPALLREIERAAARGGQLVERLSSTGREEDVPVATTALRPVLERVERMAASTLPANVRLRVDLHDAPVEVAADPARLELAILNLAVNARDALREGGTILVRAVADTRPDRVRLSVVDDGEGMTPDVLARATEAYETTKAPGHGTGLGLSMVANFVEEAGGTLSIESRLGTGTRVEMILPTTPPVAGAFAAA